MYRDDQEALQSRLDGATREAERLRKENAAMRETVGRLGSPGRAQLALPLNAVYTMDIRVLPLEERARLADHRIKRFPVWLVGVLNVLTFGLFPVIHFGRLHDRLPRAQSNDPSSSKAIGFQFIPYYNLYWIFFSALRLCDRLSLQLKLRGLPKRAPRGLVLTACIFSVIPYVNLITLPILWTIAACRLQSTVNRIAELSPAQWDATLAMLPSPAFRDGAIANPSLAGAAFPRALSAPSPAAPNLGFATPGPNDPS
jgi:hypothetical protein